MAAEQSKRSVEIQISNNTKDVTLRKPRIFLPSGHCSVPPRPSLPPGSKDSFKFSSSTLSTCDGVLTYESERFTLAIFFSNPMDHGVSPVRLGLKIFPVHVNHSMSSNHLIQDISLPSVQVDHSMSPHELSREVRLGNLEFVYDHMVQVPFHPVVVTKSARGTHFNCAQVSNNAVQLVATMSNACSSVVKVDVDEWRW